jgi:NAD(P)-dependent dehydrogenase (short-subunit alcohol dehydrogenase family)
MSGASIERCLAVGANVEGMKLGKGNVAVVTGAASGIGLALSKRFAKAGLDVVMADLEPETLTVAADSVRAFGGEVMTQQLDVSSAEAVEVLAVAAFARFGAVHVLCNNAGVGGGGDQSTLTVAEWMWVLGVNLHGVVHGIASFLPRMMASGEEGHIVNTASMAGHVAAPGMGPYNASKFAVVGLSESLFYELNGSPIGVSVLCPGWVRTNIDTSDRNRPAGVPERTPVGSDGPRSEFIRAAIASGHDPDGVAEIVFEAVEARKFWVFTHTEMLPAITARAEGAVAGRNPGSAI